MEKVKEAQAAIKGLYSIPAAYPFASHLAQTLLHHYRDASPLAWSSMVIFTPNRRSIRSLEDAFLDASPQKSMLLPAMMALGDDEEEALLWQEECRAVDEEQSIPLEQSRVLFWLYQRIVAYGKGKGWSAAQAMPLAHRLRSLLHQLRTQRASLQQLEELKNEEWSEYWQRILEFLSILQKDWQRMLQHVDRADPFIVSEAFMQRRMELWRDRPPATPVMIVGSTGSRPLTSDLMALVRNLPQGAVVLPGVDESIAEDDFNYIGKQEPTHPQYGLVQLLGKLDATRDDVQPWPIMERDEKREKRSSFIQSAFHSKPSSLSSRRGKQKEAEEEREAEAEEEREAFFTLITAHHPQQEARIIKNIMMGHLADESKRIALITPNATLNRLVFYALKQEGLVAQNSFGAMLNQSPVVVFMRLILDAADCKDHVAALALMKHPLFAFKQTRQDALQMARSLERDYFRQSQLEMGEELQDFWQSLQSVLKPLSRLLKRGEIVTAIARNHLAIAIELATTHETEGTNRLAYGVAGKMMVRQMDELILHGSDCGTEILSRDEYHAFFNSYMGSSSYHDHLPAHPRLFLWGTLEARLHAADVAILGGMNEGSYPPSADVSPFLNAKMQRDIGLPLPDWRVGLSAHDFVQSFSHGKLYLTHSLYNEDKPCELSRFVTRLKYILPSHAIAHINGDELFPPQDSSKDKEVAPPFVSPMRDRRPPKISVSALRDLVQDPYHYYGRHILGLEPARPLNASLSPKELGTWVHDILHQFVENSSGSASWNELEKIMESHIYPFEQRDETFSLLWRPKLREMLEAFWRWQQQSQKEGWQTIACEQRGEFKVGNIMVRAKCDRIDQNGDGRWRIIDYKTGSAPSLTEIKNLRDPQLMVEVMMGKQQGFKVVHMEEGEMDALCLKLKERSERAVVEVKEILLRAEKMEDINFLQQSLETFLRHYLENESVLKATGDRQKDYDHFMRKAEWYYG